MFCSTDFITLLLIHRSRVNSPRGKVRDSTLEFKGVHVTLRAVFVTDSKSIFTFSVTYTVLILDFLSKTVEVAF